MLYNTFYIVNKFFKELSLWLKSQLKNHVAYSKFVRNEVRESSRSMPSFLRSL